MIASVTRRSTFAALRSDGDRVRHGPVRVRTLAGDHPEMQPGASLAVAFAFGRRFGTAVDRNRAKRRLRAAVRDAGADSCTGAVLVSGSRQILVRPYTDLVDDVRTCLRHLAPAGAPDQPMADLASVKISHSSGGRPATPPESA